MIVTKTTLFLCAVGPQKKNGYINKHVKNLVMISGKTFLNVS